MSNPIIGSISTGTLREDDLIPAFLNELENFDPARAAAIRAELETADDETKSMILNEDLFDALDAYAPDGCYFGAHPGDGADFGFWESEDQD